MRGILFANCSILAGLKLSNKQGCNFLASVEVVLTTWLTNLGALAFASAGGVLALNIVECSVFWVGAVDGEGFHDSGVLFNWSGLPTAFSLFVHVLRSCSCP
ncbi:hypothetical protein Ancab_028650 [Ancistrocladus abbreviatus]